MNIPDIKTSFSPFINKIEIRYEQIIAMFEGQSPPLTKHNVDLINFFTETGELTHTQKAILSLICTRLQELDRLSQQMHSLARDINGFASTTKVLKTNAKTFTPVIDQERLLAALRVIVSMWIAYLSVIYIESVPGGGSLVTIAGAMGMVVASMPTLPITLLYKPLAFAIALGSIVYIFIMPMLSQFWQLGLLIFIVTAGLCYYFYEPKQMLGRAFGLAMFVNIASISNEQTYSFMVVATTALMFPIVFLILAITAYIPFSPQPEKVFKRLLLRFFKSSDFLIEQMHNPNRTQHKWVQRYLYNYHRHEILTLPAKIAGWVPSIRPECSPAQVKNLQESLLVISNRIQELLAEQDVPQSAILKRELQTEFRQWHQQIKNTVQSLAFQPSLPTPNRLNELFSQLTDQVEKRIEFILDKGDGKLISEKDGVNFYRLLGVYNSLSAALIDYSAVTEKISWPAIDEEQF